MNKLIVCESCEAEYKIYHDMNDLYYIVLHCTFCGANLSKELEDHVEIPEDWEDEETCGNIGVKQLEAKHIQIMINQIGLHSFVLFGF